MKNIGEETCGQSSIPATLSAHGVSPGRRNVNLKKAFPWNMNGLRLKRDEMKTSASRASGLFAACGPQRRGPTLWQALACSIAMFAATAAFSADPDLARAGQFVREGKYQEAYDLLLPFQSASKADAAFNALLGQAALRTNRAAEAVTFFERSLAASPDSVDAHLGLGRAYLALGDYASAKIEFETVLRFDDLPADLHQQVEIYAEAARGYAEGKRLLGFGYAIAGFGNYRVNATVGTNAFGGGDTNDNFLSARVGGGLNYELEDSYALAGSLDYRYRKYDNADRRDDSDLRWNGSVSRTMGESNLAGGVRGRVSYRGNGQYRNDYGLYGDWRYRADSDDQFTVGAEFRRRNYPSGPLKARSRNIAELTGGWTTSLLEGKASFTLAASGGREFATDDRPDGDSNFFGLSPSLNFTLTDTLGAFVFGWWQHDRYNIERINVDAADNILGIGKRNDNLYEVGGGLTWEFAKGWSLNPEILYIRDQSNILAVNYSSTEIWITLRKDF
jgi:tetratricopeptide (TPR) repeat protein